MTQFVGCIFCGIKQGFALKETCVAESILWGTDLVQCDYPSTHQWVIMTECPNWLKNNPLELG